MAVKKGSATTKKPSAAVKKAKKAAPSKAVQKAGKKPETASIDRAQRDQCEVIEMGGNSFIIVVETARNFFDLSEMRTLVNISHNAADEKDGAVQLYRWLAAHRKDVLIDSSIATAMDPALYGIYRYLVSHYTARK